TAKVKAFVDAYNKLEATIVKLRGYDAATHTGGPMLGDALVTGLEQQLRRMLTDRVSGATSGTDTLGSLGIKTQADGSLFVDQGKLEKAMAADPDAVTKLFVSADGVVTRLTADLKTRLAEGAAIDARSDGLIAKQRSLSRQVADIDARMEVIHARYLKQFTALDNLLSSMQTTSSYLGQQIDNLPKIGRN
ncbi:MAG: flagellar filament capping protein FliD, partial [Steroidobacteraceae bacterium]